MTLRALNARGVFEWCTVVHTAPVFTSPLPPMSERIRLTITVTPEVHAIFSRMADAAGISLGKCMGEWLADTSEGAQLVAMKMEEARRAPMAVMREFQAMARGLVETVDQEAEALRAISLAAKLPTRAEPGREQSRRPAARRAPPSSNTGGKSPKTTTTTSPTGRSK